MIRTSAMSGTLVSSKAPSARMAAAISFNTEFLAPPTRMAPESGPPARTTMRSTGCQYGRTMATIRATWPVGPDPADPVRRPALATRRHRTSQNAEDDGSFSLRRGARSALPAHAHDLGNTIEEVTEHRLAIPWFAWLFALPVRATLKRPPAARQGRLRAWWAHPIDSMRGPPRCSACWRRRR